MEHTHNEDCIDYYRDHRCHFCGEDVCKLGFTFKKPNPERHYLSDCRPDLVEHEIGDTCTWAHRRKPLKTKGGSTIEPLPENRTCYTYESDRGTWTDEHTHFYPDGPT